MIHITPYRSSDFQSLLQLNLDDQQNWWHISSTYEKQEATTWDQLTPFERYVHGGPWLDPHTLDLHIKLLYESSGIIFLAKQDQNVIGEIEIAQGTHVSLDNHSTLKTHLIWFLVHPSHQQQGIGTKLFLQALTYTKQINATYLQAEPEDERSQIFYEKRASTHVYKHIITITRDTWEPKGVSFPYQEITFSEFFASVTRMYRLLGTFYTTPYDLYRIRYVHKLHEILQDQPQLFKLIQIQLPGTSAYAVLSSKPRLWILPKAVTTPLIHDLISFLIEELFLYGEQELEIQVNQDSYELFNLKAILDTPHKSIPSYYFYS